MEAFEDELLEAIRERTAGETVLGAFRRFVLQPRGVFAIGADDAAEGFAAAWPGRSGEFADKMNGMPKLVASTTLRNLEWATPR